MLMIGLGIVFDWFGNVFNAFVLVLLGSLIACSVWSGGAKEVLEEEAVGEEADVEEVDVEAEDEAKCVFV